jgi:hypothetical protein
MPLPIVLHGWIAAFTGEYVVSGKLLAYATAVALLVTVFVVLRELACPLPIALALTAILLATNTGWSSSLNVRADLLPLLLQLLAVRAVVRSTSRGATIRAGLLAALALVAKLSAVWAPIAIVAWLFGRDRRRASLFVGAYAVAAGVLLGAFAIWSDGRIFENVFGLSTSGVTSPRSILDAPHRLIVLLVSDATAAWAIVPFAAAAVWRSLSARRSSAYVLALVSSVVVLLVVLVDVGTGWNQLVDVVALASIVTGQFVGGLAHDDAAPRAFGGVERVLALALVWVLLSALAVTLLPDVEGAVTGTASYRIDPLAGVATHRTRVLAEDPYVPVSLGQTPEVVDPFMLPRVGAQIPAAVDHVVAEIERGEFDLIVLVEPLRPVARSWWTEEDFGLPVAQAIAASYRYVGRAQGYYVYAPAASA